MDKERSILLRIQNDLLTFHVPELILADQQQCRLVAELTAVEESFLKQKSKIQWLREGDQNTSYFFKIVQGRNVQKKITSLQDANGTLLTDEQSVKQEILI